MADKKYRATAISLSAEQLKVLDEAHVEFAKEIGCKISRSVFLTMLCARYNITKKGEQK